MGCAPTVRNFVLMCTAAEDWQFGAGLVFGTQNRGPDGGRRHGGTGFQEVRRLAAADVRRESDADMMGSRKNRLVLLIVSWHYAIMITLAHPGA